MEEPRATVNLRDKCFSWIGVIVLIGVAVPALGYFSENLITLYTGLLATLAGVLTRVVRLTRSLAAQGQVSVYTGAAFIRLDGGPPAFLTGLTLSGHIR